jgi:DNA-binding LytR/AlgR family response regulator
MVSEMKIAVCDDDSKDRQILADYIGRYDASLGYELFASAEELMDALSMNHYELIFLDIEMGGLDGFNAAKIITETGDSPLIVFVTKSSKYTIRGYEVAFRYLVKPLEYDDFARVMKAALEQIVPQKIPVEFNGKSVLISTRDILYIEILNHNTRFHTENGVYDGRNSLKNLEAMLEGCPFSRPHNSFLVNMEHVISFTQSEILMKDLQKIIISRKRKDEFFKAMHQYLRR